MRVKIKGRTIYERKTEKEKNIQEERKKLTQSNLDIETGNMRFREKESERMQKNERKPGNSKREGEIRYR